MNKAQLLAGLCICMLFVVTGCQAESVTTTVHSTATVTAPVQTVTVTNTVISTVTDTVAVTSTSPVITTTADTNTVTSSSSEIETEAVWFDGGDEWFYAFSYSTRVTSTGITVRGYLGNLGLSKVAIISLYADLYDINGNIIGTTDTVSVSHSVTSATPVFTLKYETSDTSNIDKVVINIHCDYA
jgi:hypothetical protein